MASTELTMVDIPPPRDQAEENRLNNQTSWSTNILCENVQHFQLPQDATHGGSPPTYEEAINPDSTPPPSYDSLYGRVRTAYKDSSGICDFLSALCELLASAIGCSLILGITIILPISMIVMGWKYLGQCPVNHLIPTYLLIGGVCGVLKVVLHMLSECKNPNSGENGEEESSQAEHSLCFFIMIWFILGSYWVYRDYEPSYDPTKRWYCDKTLYTFAFWQVTSVYIILGTIGFFLCCGLKLV